MMKKITVNRAFMVDIIHDCLEISSLIHLDAGRDEQELLKCLNQSMMNEYIEIRSKLNNMMVKRYQE